MTDASHHDTAHLDELRQELLALRANIVEESGAATHRVAQANSRHKDSAWNLLNYLALRRRDLRPLQQRLAALGLSSLGRAEAHVLATIDAVLSVLHMTVRHAGQPSEPLAGGNDFTKGTALLAEHAEALLGPVLAERHVRIMVTMPGAAAHDYRFVHDLLAQGMDCIRINCAHDDIDTWARIIDHLRTAEKALDRPCRIAMDLAGPKLRTGAIEPGPAILKIRPTRDETGRVTALARIWLAASVPTAAHAKPASAWVQVPESWLTRVAQGDRIDFVDARGSKRHLVIVDASPAGCWGECGKTAYLSLDTVLICNGGDADADGTRIEALPPREGVMRLFEHDTLLLQRENVPGIAPGRDADGRQTGPASVSCTLPQVFDDTRPGQTIWFDDGKLGGVIESVSTEQLQVRITHAPPKGGKLRADKGINLPDSTLHLPALTAKDIEDLTFVAQHADIVQLSFANTGADVLALQEQLSAAGARQPAIVLKIETRRGFENLPDMLLTALCWPCCGVMIARGDLAVECGFERMAEVQEEILWICEAAHVPVIWATQVLESLAQKGMPSRAEVTDAAMSDRAECVMLNKGPYVLDAVRTLDNILQRMQAHQSKKQPMLRMLQLAHCVT